MEIKKVLVTGSSGYLGRYLVEGLAEAGCRVYGLDVKEPTWVLPGFQYIQGDVRDAASAAEAAGRVEAVVHAAAALAQFQPDEKVMREINVTGTANMLQASLRHHLKKFIFLSSVEVYGMPDVVPCPEEVPANPICEYGRNKVEGEKMVLDYYKKGLPAVIFRPPTIAGPRQNEPYLLDQIKSVVEGKKVIIPGKGAARLQMVHARDVVRAVLPALENPQAEGQIFNLGSRDVPTLKEMVEALYRKMGMKPKVLHLPEGPVKLAVKLWSRVGTPPISPQHLELAFRDSLFDISRAVAVLGWEPSATDLEANLETLDWYLEEKRKGEVG